MERFEGHESKNRFNSIAAITAAISLAIQLVAIGCEKQTIMEPAEQDWSGGVSPEAQKRERQKAIDIIMQNCKDEVALGIKKVKKFRKTTMGQEMPINEIENTQKSFVSACLRRHNLQRSPFMINDIR